VRRNKGYTAALLAVMMAALLAFPAAAFAATDTSPPKLTVSLSGDTLTVAATDDASGVAAIYIDGHRVNALTDGKAAVNLKDYAGNAAKVTAYAVDGAGNRSKAMEIDNPYYKPPVQTQPATSSPAQTAVPAASASGPAATTPAATQDAAGQTDTAQDTQADAQASPSAFTPEGTGTVLDNATDKDGKEFYTIATPAGNIFYLVIDKERADGGVYFLNAVTEADLAALAEMAEEPGGTAPFGGIDEQAEPAPAPEPLPEPEPEDGGTSAGSIIFVLLAAAALGGAAYYVKIMRPRKLAKAEAEDGDGWEGFFGDGEDESGCEDNGFLEDDDDLDPDELTDDELEEMIQEPQE
jgi:hypothetical protein